MRVFTGNHDPKLIGKYFLEEVEKIGSKINTLLTGFPYSTRSDCGTETVIAVSLLHGFYEIAGTQVAAFDIHRYVPSPRNQKIESAWGRYLKAIGILIITNNHLFNNKGKTIMTKLSEGHETLIYNEHDLLETYLINFDYL